jgi:voltage-gated potassium channel
MGSEETAISAKGQLWTRGALTSFVEHHALAWELTTAILTAVYVVLAFLQDQGSSGPVTVGVLTLAGIFAVEFFARLYDSPSRMAYFRRHWLDIVTCIPVAGWFRALRFLRLLGFLRLGAAVRAFGVGATASERLYGGSILWVLAPILLVVWVGAAYGYYELEAGVNPHIQTFTDALYFAFVTASTVGYGDVTPVTPAGKVLTGALIFVGIGLLGFASAQVTTKLLPQQNDISDLKAAVDHQNQVLQQLASRVEAIGTMLEQSQQPTALGARSDGDTHP